MENGRLSANHRLYDSKKSFYSYVVHIPRERKLTLRPENFVRAHPEIDFLYIPLEHEFVWMFWRERDRDKFSKWVDSKPAESASRLSVGMLFVGDKL